MPAWFPFAAVVVALTVGFVALARASSRAVSAALDAGGGPLGSPRLLAGNVVASHGLLTVAVLGATWFAAVPVGTLGIVAPSPHDLLVGAGLGVGLAAVNEAGARLADRAGFEADERLRARLAPETAAGWAWLLLAVLPLVAVAEELLFRGALVGGLAAGFGLPAWGLSAVSAVVFGLGHDLQGAGGVVVTTLLGGLLAAAFVLTGSLATVVVAHYAVNALEFVLNEGGDAGDWFGP